MIIEHVEEVAAMRKAEYPPIEDFADAMYWHSRGDDTRLNAYYEKVQAVKLKYPK